MLEEIRLQIRQELKRLKISYRKLAYRTGYSLRTINRALNPNPEKPPSLYVYEDIVLELGIHFVISSVPPACMFEPDEGVKDE